MTQRRSFFVTVAALLSAVAVSKSQAATQDVNLPEGKALVETRCVSCHGLDLVADEGYPREGWVHVLTSMVDLPQAEIDAVADYLAACFSDKPKPPAVLIPGPASVSIQEWLVPTLGSRPHDPPSVRAARDSHFQQ